MEREGIGYRKSRPVDRILPFEVQCWHAETERWTTFSARSTLEKALATKRAFEDMKKVPHRVIEVVSLPECCCHCGKCIILGF